MRLGTVAVLVENPALGSILTATLAASPHLRVRSFATRLALSTYARIAPVDMVVIDLDGLDTDALVVPTGVDALPIETIGLCSSVSEEGMRRLKAAGISEMLVKPMSPRYLLERVLSRLARRAILVREPVAPTPPPPEAHVGVVRDWRAYGDNIVLLFG